MSVFARLRELVWLRLMLWHTDTARMCRLFVEVESLQAVPMSAIVFGEACWLDYRDKAQESLGT
jgi:hypothetical protein